MKGTYSCGGQQENPWAHKQTATDGPAGRPYLRLSDMELTFPSRDFSEYGCGLVDDVRDHRVATRSRRRSWRLASLAPLAFSPGSGFLSPV